MNFTLRVIYITRMAFRETYSRNATLMVGISRAQRRHGARISTWPAPRRKTRPMASLAPAHGGYSPSRGPALGGYYRRRRPGSARVGASSVYLRACQGRAQQGRAARQHRVTRKRKTPVRVSCCRPTRAGSCNSNVGTPQAVRILTSDRIIGIHLWIRLASPDMAESATLGFQVDSQHIAKPGRYRGYSWGPPRLWVHIELCIREA